MFIPPIFQVSTLKNGAKLIKENGSIQQESGDSDIGIIYTILSKKFEGGSLPFYFADHSMNSQSYNLNESFKKKDKRRLKKTQSIQ